MPGALCVAGARLAEAAFRLHHPAFEFASVAFLLAESGSRIKELYGQSLCPVNKTRAVGGLSMQTHSRQIMREWELLSPGCKY